MICLHVLVAISSIFFQELEKTLFKSVSKTMVIKAGLIAMAVCQFIAIVAVGANVPSGFSIGASFAIAIVNLLAFVACACFFFFCKI